MQQLGTLMSKAQALAQTEQEKRRVDLWHDAIWKWMLQGREQYLGTKKQKEQ
jgi:hypothetical protein